MKTFWITTLFAVQVCAAAAPLYLVPGKFGGDGTAANPLQIFSDEHFDSVLRRAELDTNVTEIVLGEGVFQTQGTWSYPALSAFRRPIVFRGSGMYKTVVQLSPRAVTHTGLKDRADIEVLRIGYPHQNNSGPYTIEDMTIDVNRQAFGTNRVLVAGLYVHGNNVTVRRVRVVGLRGRFEPALEGFGILVNNFPNGPYEGPDGNNVIEHCVVETNGDVEEYCTGIYMGTSQYGRPILPNHIRDCTVLGTGSSKPLRIAYSFNANTTIERCFAHNIENALYNDTGTVTNIHVSKCVFTGITYAGLWLTVGNVKDNITVSECVFQYNPGTNAPWIGLTVWDKFGTHAPARRITIRNNWFIGPEPSGNRVFWPISTRDTDIADIQFVDNRMPAQYNIPPGLPTTNNVVIQPQILLTR